MPRFFYSASNLQNYRAPESWWRRWRKKMEKRQALKRLDANLVQVKNPFKKEVKEQQSSPKIGLILAVALFFGWLIIMLFLPYFRITNVNFKGLNIIKTDEINSFISNNFLNPTKKIWPSNNYFILNKNKIVNSIKNNFSVDNVVVEKIFPNYLQISVQEKTSSIVYDNGRSYILLDNKGNFIRVLKAVTEDEYIVKNLPLSNMGSSTVVNTSTSRTFSTSTTLSNTSTVIKIHQPNFSIIKKEIGNFPLIYDERAGKENKNILEEEVVTAVLAWHKLLQGAGVGEVQYFILDNLAGGLKIKTSEPFDILVNIHGNNETALSNLKAVLKESHPNEYVDLRYGEKVYLK